MTLSENATIVLYWIIVIVTSCLASKSNYKKRKNNVIIVKNRKFLYWFSCFFACFFMVCTDISNDYYNYIRILNWVSWDTIFEFTNAEPGFQVLWLLFKLICNNPYLFMALVKMLAIIFVFKAIWQLRNRINVGIAVLAYMCFLYLDTFNLSRMMLSVGMCIYAVEKIIDGKNSRAIMIIALACTIHTSAILFFVAVVLFYILNRGESLSKLNYIIIIISMIGSLTFIPAIYNFLVTNIDLFSHYTKYSINGSYTFSPVLIIRFIPIVFFLYHVWKRTSYRRFEKLMFVITLSSIYVSLLSYSILTITRANSYFYVLQVIFLPLLINVIFNKELNVVKKKIKYPFNYRDTKILLIVYCLFFLMIKCNELSISGIQCYKMIF